eukprot:TRINITY_DN3024_c0_g2_i1.p1 TRINITY_DN3024_c0_g2~~TRINITY_DN3024_c0_g2_i1.p1  ORF type:complete len:182 (-),score=37.25 TRINITY_DN3024_c0_g2_i1:76-585(-)
MELRKRIMKPTTLCYLMRDNDQQILLAMKKRGLGQGKWNGPGGKVESGETIEEGAVRECREECALEVSPTALLPRGVIEFEFENEPNWNNRCHLFVAREFSGTIQETEEMRPLWWNVKDIPYDHMWPDDKLWLADVLNGAQVYYRFVLNNDVMVRYQQFKEAAELFADE